MKREKEISSVSNVIKTISLYQPTTDPTVVLNKGYKQTDKIHNYRLTDYPFSLENMENLSERDFSDRL